LNMVRMTVRDIVASEDKSQPLPDDAIAKELGKAGITVARRTVTRLRQSMNIPSWRGRRVRPKNAK
jgi:RNA polymerase sigma-54 factor